ncbi:hypothetical protein SAMD00023353_0202290 [Rosellinia necatrix]|uniref:Uncharacterized protein n=1 Tax=Rosellinia necatrix TaxID=77044 RepID=A0A1S8A518_ROSNE|nr:hypothetical protein SAMD00023353_0202290 [Rosellinia necatrix]
MLGQACVVFTGAATIHYLMIPTNTHKDAGLTAAYRDSAPCGVPSIRPIRPTSPLSGLGEPELARGAFVVPQQHPHGLRISNMMA